MALDRGKISEAKRLRDPDGLAQMITVGEVVDTNDPQQMGRLRVACPLFSELPDEIVDTIPWAMCAAPFSGTTTSPSRGRGDEKTSGEVAYGMFNTPKVGSHVLIAFIDGDPKLRAWLGCLHDQHKINTMPHGRYSYQTEEQPDGPFSSTEDKIQPLYDSQTESFKKPTSSLDIGKLPSTARTSFEFRTRAADHSVGGLDSEIVDTVYHTFLADDFSIKYTEDDGSEKENTQGYRKSRVESDATSTNTEGGVLYDPQSYSWTTPGFHSIAMMDAADNCRVRFRTTHGHQIIMDDTNERIYISTAGGKTWIEMDEAGNVDVYAERNLSFHAEQDINFTTEKAFRVTAKEGIHMESDTEIRLHAKKDMHIKTDKTLDLHTGDILNIFNASDINIKTGGSISLEAAADIDFKTAAKFVVDAATDISHKAGGNHIIEAATNITNKAGVDVAHEAGGAFKAEGGADASLLAGGNVLLTGDQVHFNGPPAPPAGSASGALVSPIPGLDETTTKDAYWTSRVPEHEPWARIMTDEDKADDTDNPLIPRKHVPDLSYDDPNVGKEERGVPITRNKNWHR